MSKNNSEFPTIKIDRETYEMILNLKKTEGRTIIFIVRMAMVNLLADRKREGK